MQDGGVVGESSDTSDYDFSYHQEQLSTQQRSFERSTRCRRRQWPFGCVVRENTYTVIFDEEWRNTFSHSINASRPVDIQFMGHDEGGLQITSRGEVVVNGNISNINGETRITSHGGITQRRDTAAIKGELVYFDAIGGTIGMPGQGIRLDQEVAASLQIQGRGDVVVEAFNGDLVVGEIVAGEQSRVVLSAEGNILASSTDSHVIKGQRIQLTSRIGHIGSEGSEIHSELSEGDSWIAAEAAGNIRLREGEGDLRVKSIISHNGDVTLTAMDGSVLDANTGERGDLLNESERMAIYQDMRLTGDTAQASIDDAVENYRQRKEQEYREYWTIRGEGQEYDPNTRVTVGEMKRQQLKQQNEWTDAEVDAYQDRLTEQYHSGHLEFGDLATSAEANPNALTVPMQNYHYQLSTEERMHFNEGSVWSANELANTISAGAANSEVLDSQSVPEEVNIKGQHITLNAGEGMGDIRENIVLSGKTELTDEIREALRVAERGDLSFDGSNLTIRRRDDLDISSAGRLQASAEKSILMGSENDILVESITSSREVQLKTEGGLRETGNGDRAISAGSLTLESDDGAIGEEGQNFRIELAQESALSARSKGNIHLSSHGGHLGIDEIISRKEVHLSVSGQSDLYDYHQDQEVDIRADTIDLDVTGHIGNRNAVLDGKESALDVSLEGDAQLDASSEGGVVNLNIIQGDVHLGQIIAHSGAAIYANSNMIMEGSVQVTDPSSNLGAILEAEGQIDGGSVVPTGGKSDGGSMVLAGGKSDAGSVVLAGDARLDLVAGKGIGGKNSLAVDAARVSLSNESGDVSLVGQRDLQFDKISQTGEGKIQLTSTNDITLGGREVSLGDATLNVTGEKNLIVAGDLSSHTGEIILTSQDITFQPGVAIATEAADADVKLHANRQISGSDLYIKASGVHLNSDGTIGSDDADLMITVSGTYENIQAGQGIYLKDIGRGLTMDTENEGQDNARVLATARNNLRLGTLSLDIDAHISVGGDSFTADHLESDSMVIEMANPSGLAEIDTITTQNLDTQVNNLSIAELRGAGPIDLSLSGSNNGRAQNIDITSTHDLPFTFSRLNTEQAELNFQRPIA